MIEITGYEVIEKFNAEQITQPWDLITYRNTNHTDVPIVAKWKKYFKSKGHPYAIIQQDTKEVMMVEYTADDLPEATLYELPLFMQRLGITLPK